MNNNNKSVTFVYGSDDFLVDRRARIIFDEISNGCGEIFVFDTDNSLISDINNAIAAMETVALFDSGNSIWLRAVSFLGGASLSEEKNAAVQALVEATKASRDKNIVISASQPDKRTKLFKELTQNCSSICADSDNKAEATESAIEEFVRANHVRISQMATKVLRMKCGADPRALEQEICKLATYVLNDSDCISEDDIDAMVDDYAEGDFFAPIEHFFDKNVMATLDSLDKYFFHNGDARPLLAAFQSRNRTVMQLHCLIASKRLKIYNSALNKNDFLNAAKSLNMDGFGKSSFNIFSQNTWYLSRSIGACARFSLQQLIQFQILFTNMLFEISSQPHDQQRAMKQLITKCLA